MNNNEIIKDNNRKKEMKAVIHTASKFIFLLVFFVVFNLSNVLACDQDDEEMKRHVKASYGEIAKSKSPCFSCGTAKCEDSSQKPSAAKYSLSLGYSAEDLKQSVDADLGLGCGNPTAIASLKPGEVVVDLGSGAGFDCFLAADKVGHTGKVIGVDMTLEMIELAQKNALSRGLTNVEFVLGDIEKMPIPSSIADVIISNCVINLSPNKEAVFNEAGRILKIGGRLAISDIVTTTELPDEIKKDIALFTGCITGATKINLLHSMMVNAGFGNINIDVKDDSRSFISKWAPNSKAEDFIAAAYISATKIK